MASRSQALLVLCLLAVVSLIVKPAGILAGAALVLIVLKVNVLSALLLAAASLAVAVSLEYFLARQPHPYVHAIVLAGLMFLPSVGAALVLKVFGQLRTGLVFAAAWVALAVLITVTLSSDHVAFWQEQVRMVSAAMKVAITDIQVEQMASLMMPALGMIVFFSIAAALLLGLSWLKTLYPSECLVSDFHQLQFGKVISLLLVGVLILGALENSLAFNVAGIVLAMCILQGMSVAHALVKRRQLSNIWLCAFYLILVLIPKSSLLVSTVGIIDNWVNVRNIVKEER